MGMFNNDISYMPVLDVYNRACSMLNSFFNLSSYVPSYVLFIVTVSFACLYLTENSLCLNY